jgi:hypothetical protein
MSAHLCHTTRTVAERNAHVLRAIGDCRSIAAQRLAAEERYQEWADHAERMRLLREAGVPSAGIAARLALFRAFVGAALIRAGELLRGGPEVTPSTNPLPGA